MRSASVKCEVRGVKKVFAWRCIAPGSAQVMFLDNNTATASHKARTGLAGARRMQVL